MIVNLNDIAFQNAKQNDIFIIEEKNGKLYATPISKEELLKEEIASVKKLKKELKELKEEMKNLQVECEKYSSSIYKFIDIMKGE